MSEDNKVFQNALSSFTFDCAARGAIRHLSDLGYNAEEIRSQLSYPVPLTRIEKELDEYAKEKAASVNGETKYEFVRETDAYGKTSFRRVPKDGG